MAFHVTQCPGCESTFNTSARLLESAAGKVRCGSCLTVFKAVQNFVDQEQLLAPDTPEDSVFIGNNPLDYFDPSSFLTRSALTEDISEPVFADVEIATETPTFDPAIKDEQAESIPSDPLSDPRQDNGDTQELPLPQEHSEEVQEPDPQWKGERLAGASGNPVPQDLPWSQKFQESREIDYIEATFLVTTISEHSDQNRQTMDFEEAITAELEEDVEADVEADVDEIENEYGITQSFDEIASEVNPDDSSATAATDEASALLLPMEKLHAEALPEPEAETGEILSEFKLKATADPVLESEPASVASEPTQNEADSTEAIRARALNTELIDEESLEAIPAASLALLRKVSTPVELLASRETRWLRQLLLGVSILLLTTALTAQFLWQHMVGYSQLTQIRPFYELGCQWLSCELPVYSSIDAIRSDNLVVRSHPERSNALLVNVEFRNSANFPQLFPIMILSFNTITNDVVAIREFSPAEYLDPGLQSISLMPVHTPVQISLELIDPGPNAMNYTLAFRRPSTFN